jgi:hypothetical protein
LSTIVTDVRRCAGGQMRRGLALSRQYPRFAVLAISGLIRRLADAAPRMAARLAPHVLGLRSWVHHERTTSAHLGERTCHVFAAPRVLFTRTTSRCRPTDRRLRPPAPPPSPISHCAAAARTHVDADADALRFAPRAAAGAVRWGELNLVPCALRGPRARGAARPSPCGCSKVAAEGGAEELFAAAAAPTGAGGS